jgi:hypothetical protein
MTGKLLRFFFVGSITFLETLHPAGAVDEFLLAGVKGVTFVADINMGAFNGGFCLNNIAARTRKGGGFVFGMDFFFHKGLQLNFRMYENT